MRKIKKNKNYLKKQDLNNLIEKTLQDNQINKDFKQNTLEEALSFDKNILKRLKVKRTIKIIVKSSRLNGTTFENLSLSCHLSFY